MRPDALARVGRAFGRYEILAPIASGGMGAVYVAKARGVGGFQRRVALKVLHAHYAHDEDFVAMFLDEARLAARIHHPNVVATLDVVEEPELAIVMELVEGAHLGALGKRAHRAGTRLDAPVVLRIVLDALEGLAAAHELTDEHGALLGLVHRDVSPQNILVGADGVARLTDFGVARAEARLTATRDGAVKGKLGYMSPEHVTGGPIDLRADLFAMGVVLWEGLTGTRLFAGESTTELVARVSSAPIPRLSSVAAPLSVLDGVLARALARDPSERFTSAREMAAALEDSGALIAPNRRVGETVRSLAGDSLRRVRAAIDGPSAASAEKEPTGPTAVVSPQVPDEVTKQLSRARGHIEPIALAPRSVETVPSSPGTATPERPRSRARVATVLATLGLVTAAVVGAAVVVPRPVPVDAPPPALAPDAIAPGADAIAPTIDTLAGDVRVMGSDTIGASLLPAIADALRARHPAVHVQIEALGSSTAFVGLVDGSADLGMASRRIHDDEAAEATRLSLRWREAQLGWDGVAIIVHRGRTLPSLDVATLRAIYRGHPPESLGAFHVIARPTESGTHAFFAERVMGGQPVSRDAITIEHNDEIVRYVASDPAAIAYVGAGFVTDDVQVVPVLDDARVPRTPDHRTIANGAYPLARPLLLYVPDPASEATLALVRAAFAEDGRRAIDGHGFVAVDPPAWLGDAHGAASVPSRAPLRVAFESGSHTLSTEADTALHAWCATHGEADSYVVQGHAGADEDDPDALSASRASRVAEELVQTGVERARILTIGLGASRPIGPLGSERRRALGPRAEVFAVSAPEGVP
jgi:serine/threonine-protein kinase